MRNTERCFELTYIFTLNKFKELIIVAYTHTPSYCTCGDKNIAVKTY